MKEFAQGGSKLFLLRVAHRSRGNAISNLLIVSNFQYAFAYCVKWALRLCHKPTGQKKPLIFANCSIDS